MFVVHGQPRKEGSRVKKLIAMLLIGGSWMLSAATVRANEIGLDNRPPTAEELERSIFYAESPSPSAGPPPGEAYCRVVTSGPDNDLEKIEFAIMQGVALARRSVRIMTPYFLPDARLQF